MSEGSCGNEPFALRVLGDSMSPEFEEGHIIIIDPDGRAVSGAYVLAQMNGEYIFRQLHIENDRYYLKPLNANYPTLEISGFSDIHGVIVQRAGRRRSERKHYD
ncbi:S24 family peptidase [Thioflexithrix psekupsensis]|jgi:DNA polymerase V|uniref:Peptidase S24/S26A/S26B/S26C domain-containing protein n=1 Tax=Thioflexithrix psekupsensis TaxID=1570016 RepID=A0A251X5H1_9GAMM|nr:S24 family peptidase [Thioflexithrix psekupsensis]OUD12630.1 hypothetical protein TPSD3_16265 [Thioflexithrix psekupsensis]